MGAFCMQIIQAVIYVAKARDSNTNRQKACDIYIVSDGQIPLVEIASQLNVPEGTIRGWKNKDKWQDLLKGIEPPKKKEQSVPDKTERSKKSGTKSGTQRNVKTTVVDKMVESVISNKELTDKQRLFCLYMTRCFNATKSYMKAYGVKWESAAASGPRLLDNVTIREEIERLKQVKMQQSFLKTEDLFQKYMDIAFADITDYMDFGQEEVQVMGAYGPVVVKGEDGETINVTKVINTMRVKESCDVDGSLIESVTQTKDGFSIKLISKDKALKWLTDHMDMATAEQQARIDMMRSKTDVAKEDDEYGVVMLPDATEGDESYTVVEGGDADA